jgi:4-amino-4-deoxy-L-arabinose transferase-like glycosyltransferase
MVAILPLLPRAHIQTSLLVLILLIFAVLATSYSFVIPIFEAPDENAHLARVNYYYVNRTIFDANLHHMPLGLYPPLYHATLAALLYASGTGPLFLPLKPQGYSPQRFTFFNHSTLDRNLSSPGVLTFHALRLVSVLFGLGTVLVTYLTGKIVFHGKLRFALLAAATNAFIPQFTFISSALNYDSMVSFLSALSLYFLLAELSSPDFSLKTNLKCGLAGGAAMLTKYNGAFLLPLAPAALIVKRYFVGVGNNRKLAVSAVVCVGGMLLVAGWYYLEAFIFYGSFTRFPSPVRGFSSTFFTNGEFFEILFRSFWFAFGWMNIWAPRVTYFVLALLSGFALVGVAYSLKESYNEDRARLLLLSTCMIGVLIVLAGVIYFNFHFVEPQGRYMFPAISAISVLLVEGLRKFGNRFLRNTSLFPVLLVVLIFFLDLGGLIFLSQLYSV